jgi:hypothetical protein
MAHIPLWDRARHRYRNGKGESVMLSHNESLVSGIDFYFTCDECRKAFVLRKGYILEEMEDDDFDNEIRALGLDPDNAPLSYCDDCHLRVN